jgi:putative hydrolases of HD superfamily
VSKRKIVNQTVLFTQISPIKFARIIVALPSLIKEPKFPSFKLFSIIMMRTGKNLMDTEIIQGRLMFLKEAENLKNIMRSSYTSNGRNESTAEHTWRLALLALVFEDELSYLNFSKVLKMCLVHDLGETINGDVPAVEKQNFPNKDIQERNDLLRLTRSLDEPLRSSLLSLWEEYEAGLTEEAIAVKALDKLETILQHNQGINPENFNYEFNLTYGEKYTDQHPLFKSIRTILNAETLQKLNNV